jgi:hypothetical protein
MTSPAASSHRWFQLRGGRHFPPPSPPLPSPWRHRRQIGGGIPKTSRVRARRRGDTYIGEVGRLDDGIAHKMCGPHPRRRTWPHGRSFPRWSGDERGERGKEKKRWGWRRLTTGAHTSATRAKLKSQWASWVDQFRPVLGQGGTVLWAKGSGWSRRLWLAWTGWDKFKGFSYNRNSYSHFD